MITQRPISDVADVPCPSPGPFSPCGCLGLQPPARSRVRRCSIGLPPRTPGHQPPSPRPYPPRSRWWSPSEPHNRLTPSVASVSDRDLHSDVVSLQYDCGLHRPKMAALISFSSLGPSSLRVYDPAPRAFPICSDHLSQCLLCSRAAAGGQPRCSHANHYWCSMKSCPLHAPASLSPSSSYFQPI